MSLGGLQDQTNLQVPQSVKKSQKPSKKPSRTEVDLNEDDEMSDSSDEVESDEEPSGELEDEEMSGINEGPQQDEEDSQEALQTLEKYINELDYSTSNKKRKASEMNDENPQPLTQRRRILKEQTQPGTEGEFASFRNTSELYTTLVLIH